MFPYGHRVCSEHFKGGRRTYTNNVPTITPKTENIVKPEPRATVRARNRDFLIEINVNSDSSATSTEIMEVDNEYFPSLFYFIFYFHIFKEGSPSAMLIFKGPSIKKLTKLNTIIT